MHKNALMWLAVCIALTVVPRLCADEESRAVIEKAVKAHGGEDNLAKLRAVRMKAKGW